MKRHWVYALATLFALPCAAQAQGDPGWGPLLRISPYVAVSPGFSQEGFATVFTNSSLGEVEYEIEHGSSLGFGLNAEYRVWNRFGVVVGGMWSSRGEGRLIDWTEEEVREFEGTTMWMGKAGLVMHLREVRPDLQLRRLNASIYVAPALIHDAPKSSPLTPMAATKSVNHWGLNLGAEAELPLANQRLAFTAGFEDWIIMWDEAKYSDRVEAYFRQRSGASDADVAVDPDNSHLVIFRLGLTYRL